MKRIIFKTPLRSERRIVKLPVSKSILNRVLMLKFLSGTKEIAIDDELPRDVILFRRGLSSDKWNLDFRDAGTAMRFSTAFYAVTKGERILSGTPRMHMRLIRPLVKALNEWGANIQYLKTAGYPPLRIIGKKLKGGKVKIDSEVSSQFVSALLMVAPLCKNECIIEMKTNPVSMPYIDMTIKLMSNFGVEVHQSGLTYRIQPAKYRDAEIKVEKDWSAASFFYLHCLLSENVGLNFEGLSLRSIQGDTLVKNFFSLLGVSTEEKKGSIHILRKESFTEMPQEMDFSDCPDLFIPISVACVGLGINMKFTGLFNLHLKESNRLEAMKYNFSLLNARLDIKGSTATLKTSTLPLKASFKSFDDHRIIMSLTMLSNVMEEVEIDDVHAVNKSFPQFWQDMERFGFEVV